MLDEAHKNFVMKNCQREPSPNKLNQIECLFSAGLLYKTLIIIQHFEFLKVCR